MKRASTCVKSEIFSPTNQNHDHTSTYHQPGPLQGHGGNTHQQPAPRQNGALLHVRRIAESLVFMDVAGRGPSGWRLLHPLSVSPVRPGASQRHPGRSGALLELHPGRTIKRLALQHPRLPDFVVRSNCCRRGIFILNFPPA